jgi:hypothetical protein
MQSTTQDTKMEIHDYKMSLKDSASAGGYHGSVNFAGRTSDYEDLERENLLAVLAYAARLAQTHRLQPSPP